MQKCGKILRGREDTLAAVVSTLRGERPRRSDASALAPCSSVDHRERKSVENYNK